MLGAAVRLAGRFNDEAEAVEKAGGPGSDAPSSTAITKEVGSGRSGSTGGLRRQYMDTDHSTGAKVLALLHPNFVIPTQASAPPSLSLSLLPSHPHRSLSLHMDAHRAPRNA